MLQRVVLGQVRFNLPGLLADARGVVIGRQLVARFAAIDRLVGFLRVLSAEQSIDDLQPGLRIVYARGGAGTREAIVLMPVGSPGLADVVAHAARLAGGQTFTGTGKQFVQYRDARAPFGYDVAALADVAGDLILHGTEQMVPYRIESELPLAKLVLRLSLVRAERREPGALPRTGPSTSPRAAGSGRCWPATCIGGVGRGRRRRSRRRLARFGRAVRGPDRSAFAAAESFWLFRVERLPARMHGLLTRTPGLDVFVPVTDNVAVAAGYRHPIHLGSCRSSFPSDRMHLFSPGGVTEVSPLPVLAAIEDVVRVRMPEARAASSRRRAQPELDAGVAARTLRPIDRADHGRADSVESGPLAAAPLLRAADVGAARLSGGVAGARCAGARRRRARGDSVRHAVRARRAGRADPGRDAAGARGVARPCWSIVWAPRAAPPSCFPTAPGAPFRVAADALVALELRVLGALTPAIADQTAAFSRQEPIAEPVEIENRPMGPMPLWGLRRSNPPG